MKNLSNSNQHRLATVKKAFSKFLELVGGSSCDCRYIICEGIYILKTSEVLMRYKVFTINSSIGIVESRDNVLY